MAYPKPEAVVQSENDGLELLKGGAMAANTRWEQKIDTLKDIWNSETTPEKTALDGIERNDGTSRLASSSSQRFLRRGFDLGIRF